MFKGYRNHIKCKNTTNKNIISLPQVSMCRKCNKFNPIIQSPAQSNISKCLFCGQPYYIIKRT